jgi:hypothetical protein
LTGCVVGYSDVGGGACPIVIEYDRAAQLRAAEEIAQLPQNAVIIGWMSDYSVMRDQAQSCSAGACLGKHLC